MLQFNPGQCKSLVVILTAVRNHIKECDDEELDDMKIVYVSRDEQKSSVLYLSSDNVGPPNTLFINSVIKESYEIMRESEIEFIIERTPLMEIASHTLRSSAKRIATITCYKGYVDLFC